MDGIGLFLFLNMNKNIYFFTLVFFPLLLVVTNCHSFASEFARANRYLLSAKCMVSLD